MIFPYSCTLMACSLTCGTRLHLPTPGSKLGSADLPFLSVNISTWHLERAGAWDTRECCYRGFRISLNTALKAQLGLRENPQRGSVLMSAPAPPPHSLTGRLSIDTCQTYKLCFFFLMRKPKTAHSTPSRPSFGQNLLETSTIHCELVGVGASKSSQVPPKELRFPPTPIKCQITFSACVHAAHVAYLFRSYGKFVKLFIFLNKIVQFKETLIPPFFILSRAMTPLSLF